MPLSFEWLGDPGVPMRPARPNKYSDTTQDPA